jgi:hypothetical protein
MYRHRKHICKERPSYIDEGKMQINSKLIDEVEMHPNKKPVENAPARVQETVVQSLKIDDLQEKITLLEKEAIEKGQLLMDNLKKQDQILAAISKITSTQNNFIVNVYLNQNSLNIYDKKKELYGARSAFDYLQKLVRDSKPNTKLSWISDPDILGNSATPLARNNAGQFLVQTSSTETRTCDSSQVNNISNDIVTNSVLKAINETTQPLSDEFDNLDEDQKPEDYFGPAYNSPFGDDIYHDLDHYRKIVPTLKHLKEIARLA